VGVKVQADESGRPVLRRKHLRMSKYGS
jgi:hypothetical protein